MPLFREQLILLVSPEDELILCVLTSSSPWRLLRRGASSMPTFPSLLILLPCVPLALPQFTEAGILLDPLPIAAVLASLLSILINPSLLILLPSSPAAALQFTEVGILLDPPSAAAAMQSIVVERRLSSSLHPPCSSSPPLATAMAVFPLLSLAPSPLLFPSSLPHPSPESSPMPVSRGWPSCSQPGSSSCFWRHRCYHLSPCFEGGSQSPRMISSSSSESSKDNSSSSLYRYS